jgi:hypothetical protein
VGPGEVWVLIPLAAIVMWGARGIATALAAGRRAASPQISQGADDEVKGELEALRHRVTELEERQDFTERMLTRGSHGEQRSDRAS